ncbi:uncharacterized oxidoreductase YjmC [Octopus sinensis]|uniref:Uncharacterized oxidoreductase YjmC n=1 Tax=Octopus sinensis TaxID=2607531 RepID=A0A6P7U3D3_9MOLL|nr:uncharacterized oxidoreductase YjmC [Octopus sinensis]
MAAAAKFVVVSTEELFSFVVRCIEKAGGKVSHAEALAELLVAADKRGHFSHGLNRLDMYVRDLESKITSGTAEPEIVNETPATALVEGNNILGPVVGKFCIDLAIKKAKEVGVGWVCASGSNHFGIAGWYSMRASNQGLLGMAFTNTSPLLVPTRAKKPALGTNPISVAAPAQKDDSFVLDMATTTVALGKVEINQRKDLSIPEGWGVDSNGKVTKNPADVLNNGGLLPLGGVEETGGYKGYGLALMTEIFCGVLAGANSGANIRSWKNTTSPANLGQCFVALDPSVFAPGFKGRMSDLLGHLRNMDPSEEGNPVLVAGDPERQHEQKCDKLGGIPYHPNQITFAERLADQLKIARMKPKA